MILSVISEHISIDELQKEDEGNYVHLLSRPVEFLGIPSNWGSVIYTTKSIMRAVIAKHPGTLYLFHIIECNQPFNIKLVDGKSCRVTMFENSGLAENLAIYFKGDNCTALYTGSFTRCRALLLNTLLHQYVLEGIDIMYIDNTAARSVDPVSVYSATVEILQIATKYPDYQIMMSVPPFGYEDLIFSLASTAKLKVFIESAHLITFEKYKMSKLFERDSQQARVVVKEEEVTVETIFKRFVEEKLITLRIMLCELPPKNCYENIGLFEVHWSPHPSLFEMYTLKNYVKPKSVKEIESIPRLPSLLFVKKIERNAINNSTNDDLQANGDLSGKSTPVSEIEELSEAASYILKKPSGGNQRYVKEGVNVQTRFNCFVRNYNARLHDSAWKYYNLPKRIPRRSKKDHQEKTIAELNKAKEDDLVSNDLPSVSTFSSLTSSEECIFIPTAQNSEALSKLKTKQVSRADAVRAQGISSERRQNAVVTHSRPNKLQQGAKLLNSTLKGNNGRQARTVRLNNTQEDRQSSCDFPSVSTFSSLLSSADSNIITPDQIHDEVPQINTKEPSEAGVLRMQVLSDIRTQNRKATQSSHETEHSVKKAAKRIKETSQKSKRGRQARTVRLNNTQEDRQSSCDFPSVSTFSSLLSSGDSNIITPDQIHDKVPQINTKEPSEAGVLRMQVLSDIRTQNRNATQSSHGTEHSVKKAAKRIKETSQKSKRDMEEDAQVVPNISDEVDSDNQSSEEFIREEQLYRGSAEAADHLSFADFESVSTFTSLSSLSDKSSTSKKSERISKKKKTTCFKN